MAKVKNSGVVTYSHVKFMVPKGNDYEILKDRKVEVTPLTDAEFDMQKVKEIFVERQYMTEADFDDACDSLQKKGLKHDGKFEATEEAASEFLRIESEEEAKRSVILAQKRATKEI